MVAPHAKTAYMLRHFPHTTSDSAAEDPVTIVTLRVYYQFGIATVVEIGWDLT